MVFLFLFVNQLVAQQNWKLSSSMNGKEVELKTFLGAFLRFSSFPDAVSIYYLSSHRFAKNINASFNQPKVGETYFSDPLRRSQSNVQESMNTIRAQLHSLQVRIQP